MKSAKLYLDSAQLTVSYYLFYVTPVNSLSLANPGHIISHLAFFYRLLQSILHGEILWNFVERKIRSCCALFPFPFGWSPNPFILAGKGLYSQTPAHLSSIFFSHPLPPIYAAPHHTKGLTTPEFSNFSLPFLWFLKKIILLPKSRIHV